MIDSAKPAGLAFGRATTFVTLAVVAAMTSACGGGSGSGDDASGGSGGKGTSGGSGNASGGSTASGGATSSGGTTGTGGASGTGGSAGSGAGGSGGSASANEGCTWMPVDAGHMAFYMAAAPNTNNVFMFDKDQKQLYGTADDGATWTALAKTTTDGKALDALLLKIIFDPADTTDQTFWMAGIYGESGAYHTTDGGQTATGTCFAHSQTLAVDLSDPERKTMLATDHGGGFFISPDGGVTCNSILSKLQAADAGISRAQVPYIIDSNTFIVGVGGYGGTDGVFRSTDGGETWTSVSAASPSQNVVIAPDGSLVYGLIWNRGLIKSNDDGASWANGIGYGTLESGMESVTGTFIGDGRYVNVKMLTMSGPQQLVVSDNLTAFADFLAPFPTDHMDWPDQSVGVVYSPPANKLYTYTRYGKISRCDL